MANLTFGGLMDSIQLSASIQEMSLEDRERLLYKLVRNLLIEEKDLKPGVKDQIRDFLISALDNYTR